MQFIFSYSDVSVMENIIHGANPENLYRAFNIEMPERIFDFSTNTNIISWPKINIDLEKLASNYPDPDCRKLTRLISEKENISPERILFTNGINEAIFLLAHVTEGLRTAILQPCYNEYSRAFRNAENIFDFNSAAKFKILILTNPNNPTGIYINNLSETIKKFPETVFVIDEAYRDFVNEKLENLCGFENVIIFRSLTKIFHLSGARIGYVIANEKIISKLNEFQPVWSVNSIAQELALKFLNDKEFYETTRKFYFENAPKFKNSLKNSGFNIVNSSVHYFLIKIKNDVEIIKSLLKSGIVVRHTRNFEGLNGKYIRVATRFENENKFFVDKIKSLA